MIDQDKLEDLSVIDPESLNLGYSRKTEIHHIKCEHDLYAVSGSEARCKKCSSGWSGPNILELVAQSKKI